MEIFATTYSLHSITRDFATTIHKNTKRNFFRDYLKKAANQKDDIKAFLNVTKKSPNPKPPEKVVIQGQNKKQSGNGKKSTDGDHSKWITVKQKGEEWKTWTSAKILAFASWFVVGTTTWILLGTTTVVSFILWFATQFDADDYVTQKTGQYLSESTGCKITYESAAGSWKEGSIRLKKPPPVGEENHAQIDMCIDEVNVKLSFLWMLEGRGFVKEIFVRGIRGTIDRRTEWHDPNWKPIRRKPQRGDFEFTKMNVEDSVLTLYMPYEDARPIPISIYSFECDSFRKQWLLHDILSAKSMVGIFDGCLFKYGTPLRLGTTPNEQEEEHIVQRNLKIDGINLDLLSTNATGPLGWMKEGTLDIDLNVKIPTEPVEHHWYYNRSEAQTKVQMYWNLRLNHIQLSPPLYTRELSYINNALVQPISRYINAHSKHIPLSFTLIIPLVQGVSISHLYLQDHFDGSWTPGQAMLWDAMSEAVYQSLSVAVEEQKKQTDWRKVLHYTWRFFFG